MVRKERACSKVGNEKRGRGDGTKEHDKCRRAKFRGTAIVGIDAHINPSGTGKSRRSRRGETASRATEKKRQAGV
jgi:hypothetical protein